MSNLSLVTDKGYYVAVQQMIQNLGYNDPQSDQGDIRQGEVWQLLVDGNYTMDIIQDYDCANLMSHANPYFEYFQTRHDCEPDTKELYEDFYVRGEKQERMPMGMKIDGEVAILVGNRRMRAHEMGINKGHASRCDVLIVGRQGLTIKEKLVLAHKLARIANRQMHGVRDEKMEDYSFQLTTSYKLECGVNPGARSWTEDEKKEFGHKWLIREVPHLAHQSKTRVRGEIVNTAFASHRGQSLPWPKDAEIDKNFESFWPGDVWSDKSGEVKKFYCSTRPDKITEKLRDHWTRRPVFTAVRSHAWYILRVGKQINTVITSTETVEKGRIQALKSLTMHNTNVNMVGAGMTMTARIMFVSQLGSGLDDYEAHEWNFDRLCYNRVYRRAK